MEDFIIGKDASKFISSKKKLKDKLINHFIRFFLLKPIIEIVLDKIL
jgi:hypothetical protein